MKKRHTRQHKHLSERRGQKVCHCDRRWRAGDSEHVWVRNAIQYIWRCTKLFHIYSESSVSDCDFRLRSGNRFRQLLFCSSFGLRRSLAHLHFFNSLHNWFSYSHCAHLSSSVTKFFARIARSRIPRADSHSTRVAGERVQVLERKKVTAANLLRGTRISSPSE